MTTEKTPLTIGITGTRKGMSPEQRKAFVDVLNLLQPTTQVDGCCIGVDAECFRIAKERGIWTVGRPGHSANRPNDMAFRDDAQRDGMHPSKPFLARNRDIVDGCALVVAMPYELNGRGGTNSTISYAKGKGKALVVIDRNGTCETFNL